MKLGDNYPETIGLSTAGACDEIHFGTMNPMYLNDIESNFVLFLEVIDHVPIKFSKSTRMFFNTELGHLLCQL